jgi:hypothetical protein
MRKLENFVPDNILTLNRSLTGSSTHGVVPHKRNYVSVRPTVQKYRTFSQTGSRPVSWLPINPRCGHHRSPLGYVNTRTAIAMRKSHDVDSARSQPPFHCRHSHAASPFLLYLSERVTQSRLKFTVLRWVKYAPSPFLYS